MYLVDEERVENLLEWLSIENYISKGRKVYTLSICAEIDDVVHDIKVENLDLVRAYFVCYDYLMEQYSEEMLFKELSRAVIKE